MNIFILCTGRSGSTTFIEACKNIRNFSATHESRSALLGSSHFAYPENHIEADNRLAWFLGTLDRLYGDQAYYVHLKRDPLATARSFTKRMTDPSGIMTAYSNQILVGADRNTPAIDFCLDYVETVTRNIELFLKDKSHRMDFRLEYAQEDFVRFWEWIGAEGDLDQALNEWNTRHNATSQVSPAGRLIRKTFRVIKNFPRFIRYI